MLFSITFALVLCRSYAYVDVYNEDRNLFECGGAYMSAGENCHSEDKEADYEKVMENAQVAIMRVKNEEEGFEYRCSGILVTRRHVLTAAWCFTQSKYGKAYEVRIGNTDYTEGQAYGVQAIKVHEKYKFGSHIDNIALVTLAQAVEHPNVSVVCLPDEKLTAMNLTDLPLLMAGWTRIKYGCEQLCPEGDTNSAESPFCKKMKILGIEKFCSGDDIFGRYSFYTSKMRFTPNRECNEDAERNSNPDHKPEILRACRLEGEKDACVGARGSSLMVRQEDRWFVVGIRSFLPHCLAFKNSSVVYASVPVYADWIRSNIQSSLVISQFHIVTHLLH